MAVAHDAASESHTGTTGSANQSSFSWTHTPAGTPRGVLIFVANLDTDQSQVTSVTYGGVDVPAVNGGVAVDTAVELGRCTAFFLGEGVPTGAQTVVVNRNNNANELWAVCITVTAAMNTGVHEAGIVLLQNDGTLAVQSVTDGSPGSNSLRYAGGMSGLASPPGVGSGSTSLHTFDTGNQTAAVCRETTAGQGVRNVGFSSGTSDDRAFVHLAIKEVAAQPAEFQASVTASATVAGALTTAVEVLGSALAAGAVAGALTTAIQLAGSAAGAATASAALTTEIPLAASVMAGATASGDLSAPQQALFEASVGGTASAAGALTTAIEYAAAASGSASAFGALSTEIRFGAAAQGTGTAGGDLTTAIHFAGACVGSVTTSGELTTAITLNGSVIAPAAAIGDLTVSALAEFQGAIIASVTVAASLTTVLQFQGTITGIAASVGDLLTVVTLQGVALGEATSAGDLTVVTVPLALPPENRRVLGAAALGHDEAYRTTSHQESAPKLTEP